MKINKISDKMKYKNLKTFCFLLFFFIFVFNVKIFATETLQHKHNDDCYFGEKHICHGNEESGGNCYAPVYQYHQHIGEEKKSKPNGCYNKPKYIYHIHNNNCNNYTQKECQHNIKTEIEKNTYVCPLCGKATFIGKKEFVLCTKEQGLYAYYGVCSNEKCKYMGNSKLLDETNISFNHYYYDNKYVCGKTESTIENIIYELGCGKTNETIEKIYYQKICGKENNKFYNSRGMNVIPQCSTTIVSITPKQNIQVGTTPDFTIVVSYLDGHKQEKQATKADWNSNKIYKNQNIVLYFTCRTKTNGEINTLTTTINFTNIDLNIENTSTPTQIPTQIIKDKNETTPILKENNDIIEETKEILVSKEEIENSLDTKSDTMYIEEIKETIIDSNLKIEEMAIDLPNNNSEEYKQQIEQQKEIIYGENIEIVNKQTEATKKMNIFLIVTLLGFIVFVIIMFIGIWLYKKEILKKLFKNVEDYDEIYDYSRNIKNEDNTEETKEINLSNRLDNKTENNIVDYKEKKEQSLFGSVPNNIEEQLEED